MFTSYLARMHLQSLLSALFVVVTLLTAHPATADDGASMPASPPPTGRLVLTGSTDLSNLVALWAEGFSQRDPAVILTIADPGSAVGLESLLNGTAEAVLISTPLYQKQRQRFIERYEYAPTATPVALDGVAIFVNTANPLASISLSQLDAIYSRNHRCGDNKPIRIWRELGVNNALARLPINATGLSDDSGAYYLFRRKALCGGDFRPDVKTIPGLGGVQSAISNDRAAIGFASSALRDPELRTVPLARHNGESAVAPTAKAIRNGRYPLARTLSIAYNLPPGRDISPALQAFLDFARSKQGQTIAVKAGYVALPSR